MAQEVDRAAGVVKYDYVLKEKEPKAILKELESLGLTKAFADNGFTLSVCKFTNPRTGHEREGIGVSFTSKKYPGKGLPPEELKVVNHRVVNSIHSLAVDLALQRPEYGNRNQHEEWEMKINNERIFALRYTADDVILKAYERDLATRLGRPLDDPYGLKKKQNEEVQNEKAEKHASLKPAVSKGKAEEKDKADEFGRG